MRITRAPSAASDSVAARPIPEVGPVTSTVFPASDPSGGGLHANTRRRTWKPIREKLPTTEISSASSISDLPSTPVHSFEMHGWMTGPELESRAMTKLHERIDTTLPIDETFAFIADFANSRLWDPGVATSDRVDPGPVGLGARYQLGVRMRGRVAPMEYRITTFEPPTRVVLTGEGSGVSAIDEIWFEQTATGTSIDYTADIRLGGWMRLVEPFVGGAFEKIARDALGGMQQALDERAAARPAR